MSVYTHTQKDDGHDMDAAAHFLFFSLNYGWNETINFACTYIFLINVKMTNDKHDARGRRTTVVKKENINNNYNSMVIPRKIESRASCWRWKKKQNKVNRRER